MIKEARKMEKKSKAKSIRKFILPTQEQINLEADNVLDLLKWDKYPKKYQTSPPLLRDFCDDDLEDVDQLRQDPVISNILCHSQQCERAIKQTTLSSKTNIGKENVKANILVSNQSRKELPIDFTKKSCMK